ncbi:hypothetical protein KZX45_02465 [Georgenia sp. EYE_87]|uniref:hypothetical protein n=1 Tax=Georgenia sp. EYE_87 TaxID=2853448 RepID=UPI0020069A67|nr:hypothetical protein [Georgenia sp. EYE_87]MCK6209403.1 hypothetical protein [Georgenia sp. EYE_87]
MFRLSDVVEALVRATGLVSAAVVVLVLLLAEMSHLSGHGSGLSRGHRYALLPASVLLVVATVLTLQDIL